jgi:hypothetical protein
MLKTASMLCSVLMSTFCIVVTTASWVVMNSKQLWSLTNNDCVVHVVHVITVI